MSFQDKIYKSRKTIIEMMEDRGINMDKFKQYSINEIELMLNNHPKANKDISPIDISLDHVLIKYILHPPKIRVSNIISLIDTLIEDLKEGDTLIFIGIEKLTSEDVLEEYFDTIYSKNKIFVQYFNLDTLTFNVTHHNMVPKHTLLSEEESTSLVKSLYISDKTKLPKINKTDPISKYYGIKKGDIFRISRPSETAGVSNYYRLCE